jgi:malate dehydrogenase (oxaloacetate-decarboxylating)
MANDVLAGADVMVGVSRPGAVSKEAVLTMAAQPIVFAMANPDPEVRVEEVGESVAIMATGRSDYPNQINNVLAFPGVFRGLLDARSHHVSNAMLVAAARALAGVVGDEELNANFIVPSVFHPAVSSAVAAAVRDAALAEA